MSNAIPYFLEEKKDIPIDDFEMGSGIQLYGITCSFGGSHI
jgi:hypothetical protein